MSKELQEMIKTYKEKHKSFLCIPHPQHIDPYFYFKGQKVDMDDVAELIKTIHNRFNWQHSSDSDALKATSSILKGKNKDVKEAGKKVQEKADYLIQDMEELKKQILKRVKKLSPKNQAPFSYYQSGTGWLETSFMNDLMAILDENKIPYIKTQGFFFFACHNEKIKHPSKDVFEFLVETINDKLNSVSNRNDTSVKISIDKFCSKQFILSKTLDEYSFDTYVHLI